MKKVYGVEIVLEVIEDVNWNVVLNNMINVEFGVGEVEVVILKWYKEGVIVDIMVVDLLCKGCDEVLLNIIIDMKLNCVVYVLCNLVILVCDLKVLEEGGYKM